MKRVAAGVHFPTRWLFEPGKRPDDRADYCLNLKGASRGNMFLWVSSSPITRIFLFEVSTIPKREISIRLPLTSYACAQPDVRIAPKKRKLGRLKRHSKTLF